MVFRHDLSQTFRDLSFSFRQQQSQQSCFRELSRGIPWKQMYNNTSSCFSKRKPCTFHSNHMIFRHELSSTFGDLHSIFREFSRRILWKQMSKTHPISHTSSYSTYPRSFGMTSSLNPVQWVANTQRDLFHAFQFCTLFSFIAKIIRIGY